MNSALTSNAAFCLRRLHVLHCVMFCNALQQIQYRILYPAWVFLGAYRATNTRDIASVCRGPWQLIRCSVGTDCGRTGCEAQMINLTSWDFAVANGGLKIWGRGKGLTSTESSGTESPPFLDHAQPASESDREHSNQLADCPVRDVLRSGYTVDSSSRVCLRLRYRRELPFERCSSMRAG